MHLPGVEPGPPPWQGEILPLDYKCLFPPMRIELIPKDNNETSTTVPCATITPWRVVPNKILSKNFPHLCFHR